MGIMWSWYEGWTSRRLAGDNTGNFHHIKDEDRRCDVVLILDLHS
jgi:hypothetical protein